MLTENLFEEKWKVLCKTFRREPDAEIHELYYVTLSEEIADDQFQEICQILLKRCVRFPTIAEFLSLKLQQHAPYELPSGAIDTRIPNEHNAVAWAKATLTLPNHHSYGNLKRRAREILEKENAISPESSNKTPPKSNLSRINTLA